MARIAVLSDIHGNLPALEAVIADAVAQGCDAFVNLGDILSGPLWPAETADILISLDWPTIAGNHERQLLTHDPARMISSDRHAADRLSETHRQWLAGLPPTLEYSADIFLCHGTPASDLVYFLQDLTSQGVSDASTEQVAERAGDQPERLILCGHTHLQGLVALPDGRAVANPGSVGLQAFEDDHIARHWMEAGTPHARYAIVEALNVQMCTVDYDHEAAARQAEANDRPDWAVGLRTGFAR